MLKGLIVAKTTKVGHVPCVCVGFSLLTSLSSSVRNLGGEHASPYGGDDPSKLAYFAASTRESYCH